MLNLGDARGSHMMLISMSVGCALYRPAARHLSTHRGRDGHEPQAQPPCPIDGPQPCTQQYPGDVSALKARQTRTPAV
jgi:hypothetical protein